MGVVLYSLLIIEVLVALLFYSGSSNKSSTKQKKRYLIVAFVILAVVHIFKDPYGLHDLAFYIDGFNEVSRHDFSYIFGGFVTTIKANTGWHILCKVLSFIWSDYFIMLFVVSSIILYGYYYTTKKYSPIYWLSVLLFLTGTYFQSLYVIRQHLAIAITLFSFPFIINKKLFPYLLIIGLAFSIHSTAIIFLPVYFICNSQIGIKWVALLISVGAILVFGQLHSYTSLFLESASISGYESYLESEAQTNWKMGAYLAALLLFRVFIMRGNCLNEGIDNLLTVLLFLASLIGLAGIGLSFTSRLNMYFSATTFLSIPNTASYITNKTIRILYITVLLAFNVYMLLFGQHGSWDIIQYRFIGFN